MILDLPLDFRRAVLLDLAALRRSGLDPLTVHELVAHIHGLRAADVRAIERQWARGDGVMAEESVPAGPTDAE